MSDELRKAARELLEALATFRQEDGADDRPRGGFVPKPGSFAWAARMQAAVRKLAEKEEALRAALRAALSTPEHTCAWTQDDDGNWNTSCDQIHVLIDGTPAENSMRYCCYCGGSMDTSEPTDNQISGQGILDNSTPKASREPTQEQVRAEFEVWETENGWRTDRYPPSHIYFPGQYIWSKVSSDWIAWQAAHAAGFEAGRMAGGKDAERWQALLNSARIRVIGTAGFSGNMGAYRHVGLELWNEYPNAGDNTYGKEILIGYADAIAKEPK